MMAMVAAAVVAAVQRYEIQIQRLVDGNDTFNLPRHTAKMKYRSDSVAVNFYSVIVKFCSVTLRRALVPCI